MVFPAGHFYSPVVDPEYIKVRENQIWPNHPPEICGIDFNVEAQKALLLSNFRKLLRDFSYPLDASNTNNSHDCYYLNNDQFAGLDARALYVILRKHQPRRMIEVGSGFSSLLAADVNRKWLEGQMEFLCIDPYPREFLKKGITGISALIQSKAEDVELQLFERLDNGDILFIDSSHVSKTGSDVNYLYFEVIPRLKSGVIIHIHDIFLPYDYPKQWVIEENRSWNEQYLLRAMLMFTDAFEVLFGCAYAYYMFPELIKQACDGELFGGGSFWIRKK